MTTTNKKNLPVLFTTLHEARRQSKSASELLILRTAQWLKKKVAYLSERYTQYRSTIVNPSTLQWTPSYAPTVSQGYFYQNEPKLFHYGKYQYCLEISPLDVNMCNRDSYGAAEKKLQLDETLKWKNKAWSMYIFLVMQARFTTPSIVNYHVWFLSEPVDLNTKISNLVSLKINILWKNNTFKHHSAAVITSSYYPKRLSWYSTVVYYSPSHYICLFVCKMFWPCIAIMNYFNFIM